MLLLWLDGELVLFFASHDSCLCDQNPVSGLPIIFPAVANHKTPRGAAILLDRPARSVYTARNRGSAHCGFRLNRAPVVALEMLFARNSIQSWGGIDYAKFDPDS